MSNFRPDAETIARMWNESRSYKHFQRQAEKELGRRPGLATVFRWLKFAGIEAKANKSSKEPPAPVIVPGEVLAPDACRGRLTGKRYVFTCAQNNTEVHEPFLQSLLTFCRVNDAQLVVGGITYNKTGFQNGHKGSAAVDWDARIKPYMLNQSMELAPDLIWCGEMNILPTAVRPLSGLESYCRHASGIVPHVKVAMDSIPRMKGYQPKFMYTTGAVTRRNYIEQRAGLRAAFHHVFGALYVELDDDGEWFARQLIAGNDGSFYDLTSYYTPKGYTTGTSAMAVNLGDLHIEQRDEDVDWGIDDIISTLSPQYLFLHDISDFTRRSHHNINDPLVQASMLDNEAAVFNELCDVGFRLKELADTFAGEVIVVHSNHDDFLIRWLKEADYRRDPANALTFLTIQLHVYTKIKQRGQLPGSDYSLLGDAIKQCMSNMVVPAALPDRVRFLRQDESFRICELAPGEGIECGMHGHLGANGRRGRPIDFTRLGCKCNTGHTHSAGIIDGVYTAGVSCKLDMGYNKGATSWSHSHIVTYLNGKRCIITQRGAKWRAPDACSSLDS